MKNSALYELGVSYLNKRNGKLVKLIEYSDKFKTVMLEEPDGSTISISISTFKRWYRKSESIPEPIEPKINLELNDTVEPEIQEEGSTWYERIYRMIQQDGVDIRESVASRPNYIVLAKSGKTVGEFYVGKKKLNVYLKSKCIPNGMDFKSIRGYCYDAKLSISLEGDVGEFVHRVLSYM